MERAEQLISNEDEDGIRYVALELRMCIENLSYELFQLYLNDVPDEAMKKWQPRAVLDELMAIDPHVEISWTLTVGEEGDEQQIGSEERLKIGWAHKAHNKLGNFLHAPTYQQIVNGKIAEFSKIHSACASIISDLRIVIESPITCIRFNVSHGFDCNVCGRRITRQLTTFNSSNYIRCMSCQAIYDPIDGSPIKFRLREAPWECSSGHKNTAMAHTLIVGKKFHCKICHEEYEAVRCTWIVPCKVKSEYRDFNPDEKEDKNLGKFIPRQS